MFFRLAIVGHQKSIEDIKLITKQKFVEIETLEIPFSNDSETKKASDMLQSVLHMCDGIMFTRYEPYQLISRIIPNHLPFGYAEVNSQHLTQALLYASYNYKVDIRKASIDTLSFDCVKKTYKHLDIEDVQQHVVLIPTNRDIDDYIEKIAVRHIESYQNGTTQFCVTNIRNVHQRLLGMGILSVLLKPSDEAYVSKIQQILLMGKLLPQPNNKTVTIHVKVSLKNNAFIMGENFLYRTDALHKIDAEISLFAQQIQGGLVRVGLSEYVIFCYNNLLENVTKNFTEFPLIKTGVHQYHHLNIGIGYGENIIISQSNALIALHKVESEGGGKAYIVYDSGNVAGPIQDYQEKQPINTIYSKKFSEIAEDVGLSVNTVHKISVLHEEKKLTTFTASQFALELNISKRTADRIIAKMIEKKYITQVSQHMINLKGRPTRVLSFNF